MLETNSHFTPVYQSVFQVTTLRASSLTQLAYLNASAQPSSVSMEISFIYLFFLLVQGLLVLGYCPSPYATLRVLHVAPAFQGLAKQTIISFVGCSQVY